MWPEFSQISIDKDKQIKLIQFKAQLNLIYNEICPYSYSSECSCTEGLCKDILAVAGPEVEAELKSGTQ